MTLCDCPDEVILRLRETVQSELDRLKTVKRLTATTNTAYSSAPSSISTDIDTAALSIPSFPILNPLMLVDYLICPLFPYTLLDLDIDLPSFQKLDTDIQLGKVRDLLGAALAKAQKEFADLLASSSNGELIEAIRKYLSELNRTGLNAVTLSNAIVVSSAVRTLCVSEYTTADTPYQEFDSEVSGFSITGGVPSELSPALQSAVSSLVKADSKISALKAALA